MADHLNDKITPYPQISLSLFSSLLISKAMGIITYLKHLLVPHRVLQRGNYRYLNDVVCLLVITEDHTACRGYGLGTNSFSRRDVWTTMASKMVI